VVATLCEKYSSKWEIFPNFRGENIKEFKKTTQIRCFPPFSGNRSLSQMSISNNRFNGPGRPKVPLGLELVPSCKPPKNFDVKTRAPL